METDTAFVRANGVVELYTVTQVYLYFTFIVYPRHFECKDAVRFNQSLDQRGFFKLWMQAVKEVLHSIEDIYNQHPEFDISV